jgi:hypothetical protein
LFVRVAEEDVVDVTPREWIYFSDDAEYCIQVGLHDIGCYAHAERHCPELEVLLSVLVSSLYSSSITSKENGLIKKHTKNDLPYAVFHGHHIKIRGITQKTESSLCEIGSASVGVPLFLRPGLIRIRAVHGGA